jgi:hypothetical protein
VNEISKYDVAVIGANNPFMEVSLRSSGIWEWLDCPQRAFNRQIEGMKLPSTAPAIIGTAVHASTAEFDRSRLDENEARWLSCDDTAEIVEEVLSNPTEEVNWGGVTKERAKAIGIGCHSRYCFDVAPLQFYTHVEAELTEMPIDIELGDGRIIRINLTGTLDRVREIATEYELPDGTPQFKVAYGISDVKTGGRALSQSPGRHKAQLGVYELLAEHSLDLKITLPGQILALQTSANYDAAIKEVPNCTGALVGNEHQKGVLHHIAAMLATGDFFGNASSFMCSEKYCPAWDWCLFR